MELHLQLVLLSIALFYPQLIGIKYSGDSY